MGNDNYFTSRKFSGVEKQRLLTLRTSLLLAIAESARQEKFEGMYEAFVTLFNEFERMTRHITDPNIIKN